MSSLCLLSTGSNAQGQLGIGSTDDAHEFTPCIFSGYPPGTLPEDTLAIFQVACGANHTLVLLKRSSVTGLELWGCGDGRRGQLGPSYLGDAGEASNSSSSSVFKPLDLHMDLNATTMGEYTPRLVAAGWETSYIVISCAGRSDVLISMGADDYGNLGIGGFEVNGMAPGSLHVVDLRPLVAQEYGDAYREQGSLIVRSLATGPHHIAVDVELLLSDGSARQLVAGWGKARHGQLGVLDSVSEKSPSFYAVPHTIPIRDLVHDPVVSLALGNQHSVFLHLSGRLSTCGSDRKAQLRDLHNLPHVHKVACTWNGTYAVTQDDSREHLMATGSHAKGQLGRGDIQDPATVSPVRFPFTIDTHRLTKVACGSEHILCLVTLADNKCFTHGRDSYTPVDDGRVTEVTEVWGWGWNEHGNLGIQSTEDQAIPVRIWPPAFSGPQEGHAVDCWCGNGTSWVVIKR